MNFRFDLDEAAVFGRAGVVRGETRSFARRLTSSATFSLIFSARYKFRHFEDERRECLCVKVHILEKWWGNKKCYEKVLTLFRAG